MWAFLSPRLRPMNDPDVCAFLADQDPRATWVTSACTGGLVLAAAGLLKGYDATAHWAVADLLPLMSARHVDKRVVRDRNRMTGGGVTTGQSGECYKLPVPHRSPPFKTPGVATLAGASAQSALLKRGVHSI
jgi:DJ-1/PfpI family